MSPSSCAAVGAPALPVLEPVPVPELVVPEVPCPPVEPALELECVPVDPPVEPDVDAALAVDPVVPVEVEVAEDEAAEDEAVEDEVLDAPEQPASTPATMIHEEFIRGGYATRGGNARRSEPDSNRRPRGLPACALPLSYRRHRACRL